MDDFEASTLDIAGGRYRQAVRRFVTDLARLGFDGVLTFTILFLGRGWLGDA